MAGCEPSRCKLSHKQPHSYMEPHRRKQEEHAGRHQKARLVQALEWPLGRWMGECAWSLEAALAKVQFGQQLL